MKAELYYRGIETKFIGPTNHKGSRISVRWSDGDGDRKIYAWKSEFGPEKNHTEAAMRFYQEVSDWKENNEETRKKTHLQGAWTKRGAVFCIRFDNR